MLMKRIHLKVALISVHLQQKTDVFESGQYQLMLMKRIHLKVALMSVHLQQRTDVFKSGPSVCSYRRKIHLKVALISVHLHHRIHVYESGPYLLQCTVTLEPCWNPLPTTKCCFRILIEISTVLVLCSLRHCYFAINFVL